MLEKMPKTTVQVELSPMTPVNLVWGLVKLPFRGLKKAEEFVLDQTIIAMTERAEVVMTKKAMAAAVAEAEAQAAAQEAAKPKRTRTKKAEVAA